MDLVSPPPLDPNSEKKWFVYVEDHHEGPFSGAEVQQKVKEGLLRKDQFFWAEGMPDWKAMPEIPELASAMGAEAPVPFPPPPVQPAQPSASQPRELDFSLQEMIDLGDPKLPSGETAPLLEEPARIEGIPVLESHSSPQIAVQGHDDFKETGASIEIRRSGDHPKLAEPAPTPTPVAASDPVPQPERKKEPRKTREMMGLSASTPLVMGDPPRWKKWLRWFLFLAVLAGAYEAYDLGYVQVVTDNPSVKQIAAGARDAAAPLIQLLVEKVPFLGQFLSPIPRLSDVSQAEYDELRAAASASLSSDGPQAAIGQSTADPQNLLFYVASNLPDGAQLVVRLEGIGNTLLNAMEFTSQANVSITQRLGKTKAFSLQGQQGLPKGEYNVYIYEADQQPGPVKLVLDVAKSAQNLRFPRSLGIKKITLVKKYFFGAKDKTYTERLKDYHEKVKARAAQDKDELSQVAQTLMNQYNESFKIFDSLRKEDDKKVTKGKKAGADSGNKKKWVAKAAPWVKFQTELNKFARWTPDYLDASFYREVYDLARKSSAALIQMQEVEDTFFTKSLDPKVFDASLVDAQNQARGLISELIVKVKRIETSLNENEGLPKKLE